MHRLIFSCVSCFLTCFNGCWFWWWVCVVRKSTIATPSHILLVTGQWVPSYDPTTHHRSIWSCEWPVLWEGRTSHVISSNLVWSLCRSVWETLYWSVWCSVPEGGNPCNDVLPRLTISSGQVPLLLSAMIIVTTLSNSVADLINQLLLWIWIIASFGFVYWPRLKVAF